MKRVFLSIMFVMATLFLPTTIGAVNYSVLNFPVGTVVTDVDFDGYYNYVTASHRLFIINPQGNLIIGYNNVVFFYNPDGLKNMPVLAGKDKAVQNTRD